MNCKERNFELIMDITAYRDSDIRFVLPMGYTGKYVQKADVAPVIEKGIRIPVKAKTGKLKENHEFSVSGESYTVTLSWEVSDPSIEAYRILEDLNNEYKHLIVTTFGGDTLLIRSTKEGYRFSYKESNGPTECELSVTNVHGAQRIL